MDYDWVQKQLNRFYYSIIDIMKVLGYDGQCTIKDYELHCTPCPIHSRNKFDEMVVFIGTDSKKYWRCKYGVYDFTTIAIAIRAKKLQNVTFH